MFGCDGRCVFGGAREGAPVHHVLGDCSLWAGPRAEAVPTEQGREPAGIHAILGSVLGHRGVRGAGARSFAAAIDEAARAFWGKKDTYWR